MTHYKTNICALFFGTLLTMAACQKIDAEDIDAEDENNKTASTVNKSNNADNNDKTDNDSDVNSPLKKQPDGTLLFSSDKHVVAYEYDDNGHHVVYISLHEWGDMPSAISDAGSMAIDIAGRYTEGDVTGWHIPTREEARNICRIYNRTINENMVYDDALQTLNNKIKTVGGQELRAWYKKDSNPALRYLCEDAMYSFSLKKGSNITKCGAITKYNLRLIKDSIITR